MELARALEVSNNKLGAYQKRDNAFLIFKLEIVSGLRGINWREMDLVLKKKRKPWGGDDGLQEEKGSCESRFREGIC